LNSCYQNTFEEALCKLTIKTRYQYDFRQSRDVALSGTPRVRRGLSAAVFPERLGAPWARHDNVLTGFNC
jgi:hypothetical protein